MNNTKPHPTLPSSSGYSEPPIYILSVSKSLTALNTSFKWNHVVLFVTSILHLTSLNILKVHQHTEGFPSFTKINIPSYIHQILFIYSSINKHSGCFHLLAIVNNAAVNMD